MMTTFPESIQYLPESLHARVNQYWQTYLDALSETPAGIPTAPEFMQTVARVWAASDFVAENCIRYPALLEELFISGDITRHYAVDEYKKKLQPLLAAVQSEEDLGTQLRRFRRREMLRVIWRDLTGWSNLEKTMQDLSALADACIDSAAAMLYQWQCQTLGTPTSFRGNPQNLLVLGLGKLGGDELNLSSDVDLIFAYPTPGETHGVNSISHEQFFNRLGQRLIQVLNTVTAEGFVFRVDMRLRPLGASGPLVMPFSAMENYYLEQGRDWERYALIKARVVSGNRFAGTRLLNILRPFVYRRYLDYSTIEALRQMHAMINQEAKNKKLHNNIKLGFGGIREIEFIGQMFQLINGGQETRLQDRRILHVLKLLAEMKFLAADAVKELIAAYEFLRNTEHRLQAFNDRQTHQLPEDEATQLRLAFAMNYSNWETFATDLNRHRANVSRHFQQLVTKKELEENAQPIIKHQEEAELIWLGQEQDAATLLTEMGFADSTETIKLLNTLRESRRSKNLSELGQQRLDALMPQLLHIVGKAEQPNVTLKRLLPLIEAIMRRSAYMILLLENPKTLSQLVQLCSISPWIADQLARYPLLLGELLDANRLYAPLNLAALENALTQALSSIPEEDLEQQMECLRRFKLVHLFRVAAMDVTAVLPLMRVSDHLTNIAEVILRQVQKLAWQHLVKRHGHPPDATDESNFAIIAYGKLGGIELGYGSDLDLVFLYDAGEDNEIDQRLTLGEYPVSSMVFYTRLAQRMLNILEARTTSGVLYEIDTRLRPSGESGLLIASMDTFARYQQEEAWTWEHQALVRARMISANPQLLKRFNAVRNEVLAKPRNPVKLSAEVREMRQRMREVAKIPPPGQFDLKQGMGGIADIEFMVQYGVLRWAASHPALLIYPDNIRILENFAAEGLMEIADVRLLSDAYRAYRAIVHRLDLEHQPPYVPDNQFRSYRERAQEIWHKWLETTSPFHF